VDLISKNKDKVGEVNIKGKEMKKKNPKDESE
jgi:hypothetical protein